MNNIANEVFCTLNNYLYWVGFMKGAGLVGSIWLACVIYNYFMKKKYDVKIEISERKEPKI
ncbi:hypothetical protein ACG93R_17615 [Acinetobacter guillouiae]|uniref:hypothetical protein n=1 Tax=Acinetobacter guillouiae TaxID=106649 RepID=UPI003AF922EE